MANWASVSAGNTHTVAVTTNGQLWAWGNTVNGQLGCGHDGGIRTSPFRIGTATNWASVSAGSAHTVAVRTDGTLWAWGSRADGRTGLGTPVTGNTFIPTQVGTATNWATVSAGVNHTVAVRMDATLWAWGNNASGQLGDGTITQHTSPVQIGTATDWALVSVGASYTVSVREDGVWAWGLNTNGQLGDNSTTTRSSPVAVAIP